MSKTDIYGAILLSGAPASGKDTITAVLHNMDDRIIHFLKHRAGAGEAVSDTYIDVDQEQFARMKTARDFLQSHSRYNRSYGVSYAELNGMVSKKLVPVIHVGRYENLPSLRSHPPLERALSVLLLCSREEALVRLENRFPSRPDLVQARIEAHDEEQNALRETLHANGKLDFDLIENTTNRTPEEVARSIMFALSGIHRICRADVQKNLHLAFE